jgi:hypothetical protein
VLELPAHMFVLPLMLPGVDGIDVLTAILKVCGEDEPQLLFAVTVIFPLVVLAVALIDVDVEVSDQPPGNVQVYEVAPETGAIL